MKINGKLILFLGIVIVLFPVLLTVVMGKMQKTTKLEVAHSGRTVVVNENGYDVAMDMENFIPCVLMAQLPLNSPVEVLKAQTVVLRTYILQKMGKNKTITSRELGLPYISYVELKERWFENYKVHQAGSIRGMIANVTGWGAGQVFEENLDYLHMILQKTERKVMTHNGALILPLFHGMSNGVTRSGTENLGKDYAYLKTVKCETDMQQADYVGTKFFTMEELEQKLEAHGIVAYQKQKELFASKNLDVQKLLSYIDCSDKDENGYVVSVKIGDTVMEAENFAEALGLPSTAMEISAYEQGIRITTLGTGHGFGMSLAYAKQLAGEGMDWQNILKTFYDVEIKDL